VEDEDIPVVVGSEDMVEMPGDVMIDDFSVGDVEAGYGIGVVEPV